MSAALLLALCAQLTSAAPGPVGTIQGQVVNGSRGRAVVADAVVILRVEIEGQFVAVTETTTDAQGVFRFEDVPAVAEATYLPGANCGEVHYPGPRVKLTPDQPQVDVELTVFDTTSLRNPLVIRRHDIEVRPEPGGLRVTESLQIDNPMPVCYAGATSPRGPTSGKAPPITLRLGIPAEFQRATFQREFFGRRFSWQDNELVTRIPWPPGVRQLDFTYVIVQDSGERSWQRRIDLPCDQIRLTVFTATPDKVSCPALSRTTSHSEHGRVVFASTQRLQAGELINVQLGEMSIPLAVQLRWFAVAILLVSVMVPSVWLTRASWASWLRLG